MASFSRLTSRTLPLSSLIYETNVRPQEARSYGKSGSETVAILDEESNLTGTAMPADAPFISIADDEDTRRQNSQ